MDELAHYNKERWEELAQAGVAYSRPFLDLTPDTARRVVDPHEIIEVETEVVGCDGGGGVLGHPLVYLNMEKQGAVDCPYCGRKFVLKAGARAAAH